MSMWNLFLVAALLITRPGMYDTEAYPRFPKIALTIGINPTTDEGKALKLQLERDWIEFACYQVQDLPLKARLELLKEIIPHELARRRLALNFDLKIVETSDDMWMSFSRLRERTYFPKTYDSVHPNEFPGYIQFLTHVQNEHYLLYEQDCWAIQKRNDFKWWQYYRDVSQVEFINKYKSLGYFHYHYGSQEAYDYGYECLKKDGIYYSLGDLGWKDIQMKVPRPSPTLDKNPFKEDWKLP